MTGAPPQARRSHGAAVLGTLLAASIWGASFAGMKYAIQAHLSVGVMLTLRFGIGSACLGLLMLALRVPVRRAALRDGFWLGLVITAAFWLQADGLRFTTTAKCGFITGLYVVFTPLIGLLLGHRIKPFHGLGALVALAGLFLLVHHPGAATATPGGGWNRGDSETFLCSILCALQIAMTGVFSRRSSGWVLAFTQVTVVALLSLGITALLPAAYGFHAAAAGLARPQVWFSLLYLGMLATALAFWLMMTSQAALGATEAAILYCLEPLFTALLAMSGWIPGIRERLSPLQLAGETIMLLAMVLAELGPRLWDRGLAPAAAPSVAAPLAG